jgi:hypothetical protein
MTGMHLLFDLMMSVKLSIQNSTHTATTFWKGLVIKRETPASSETTPKSGLRADSSNQPTTLSSNYQAQLIGTITHASASQVRQHTSPSR